MHFLAQQGLTLRGDGEEFNYNLHQLFHLHGEDDPALISFPKKKPLKYTSHDMHNEFLSIMAQQMLIETVAQLQSAVYYAVLVDANTDKANREQVVFVIRWVNDNLVAHEQFIDLYQTASITS